MPALAFAEQLLPNADGPMTHGLTGRTQTGPGWEFDRAALCNPLLLGGAVPLAIPLLDADGGVAEQASTDKKRWVWGILQALVGDWRRHLAST